MLMKQTSIIFYTRVLNLQSTGLGTMVMATTLASRLLSQMHNNVAQIFGSLVLIEVLTIEVLTIEVTTAIAPD
jgi:hypothetical protein